MQTLTDEKRRLAQEEISEFIVGGYTITQACNFANVTRQTFYHWLDTDEYFRRLVAFAEEEADSEVEAFLYNCAKKAQDDPRYQRSVIYYLDRRERRRDRRQDRELRAEECALRRAEIETRKLELADRPIAPSSPPATLDSSPAPATRNPEPGTRDTPRRIPAHLRPARQIYTAAPGPIVRPPAEPVPSGDGHLSPLPPGCSPSPGNLRPPTDENVRFVTIPSLRTGKRYTVRMQVSSPPPPATHTPTPDHQLPECSP